MPSKQNVMCTFSPITVFHAAFAYLSSTLELLQIIIFSLAWYPERSNKQCTNSTLLWFFFHVFNLHKVPWTEVLQSTKMFKCVRANHWPKLVFTGSLDSKSYKYCTGIWLAIWLLLVSGRNVRVSSPVWEQIAIKTFPFHISLESRKTVNNKRPSTKIIYWDIVWIYMVLL